MPRNTTGTASRVSFGPLTSSRTLLGNTSRRRQLVCLGHGVCRLYRCLIAALMHLSPVGFAATSNSTTSAVSLVASLVCANSEATAPALLGQRLLTTIVDAEDVNYDRWDGGVIAPQCGTLHRLACERSLGHIVFELADCGQPRGACAKCVRGCIPLPAAVINAESSRGFYNTISSSCVLHDFHQHGRRRGIPSQ